MSEQLIRWLQIAAKKDACPTIPEEWAAGASKVLTDNQESQPALDCGTPSGRVLQSCEFPCPKSDPAHCPIEDGDPRVKEIKIKDSNPKDSIGVRKVGYSCLPTPVLAECGVAMLEGAHKYGRHNYRVVGVKAGVYYDAVVCRHLGAWWEGEDIDKESGMSHITKAITSLMVLRDAMIRGKMVDDRPPSTLGYITALNEKAAKIIDEYPEPKDAYTIRHQPGDDYQP